MNKNNRQNGSAASAQTVTKQATRIKLGIDWHAREYRVVRMVDDGGPEKARRFTPEAFVKWVEEQLVQAEEVHSCYEAGAGGYVLHRQLAALGVRNLVVHPRDLDREHKGVSTDAVDARELCSDLDRFVRGNRRALRVVLVPTPAQEQRRQQSRQRQELRKHRLRLAAQGRSLLLAQGWVQGNDWWQAKVWTGLAKKLPEWLRERLEIWRRLLQAVEEELRAVHRALVRAAATYRPKGLGPLTWEELEREVGDWTRFPGAKRAGSYAGLCGSARGSGAKHQDGPLSKAGNKRLRTIMVELAWRFVFYQRQSALVRRWPVLTEPGQHVRGRKKAIIAVARRLFIDLWRWRTGQRTPAELGWLMLGTPPAPAAAATP